MFLGMKDFDFCSNRIKFYIILPNLLKIYPNLLKFYINLPKFYTNLSKFYPNWPKLPKKIATDAAAFSANSYVTLYAHIKKEHI